MDQILMARYPHERSADLAKSMGLTLGQVHRRAHALSIKKTPEFRAQHGNLLNGITGKKTRFPKGNEAWNKGKPHPSTGRAAEHQFKPGMLPHNHKPIGHERITADGYLERKVTDTGVTRTDYVAVHRLVWMAAHGPIPAGHVVVFRSADKTNTALDNLDMISRADLARRNSIHKLPPELKETIYALTSVKRRIKRHENQS